MANAAYNLAVCIAQEGQQGEAEPYFRLAVEVRSDDLQRYAKNIL